MKFAVKKNAKGEWYWQAVNANGRVVNHRYDREKTAYQQLVKFIAAIKSTPFSELVTPPK